MPLFAILSGLPASGKTTLAKRLAARLQLPLIDKDDILEGLFEGLPTITSATRNILSRKSDAVMMDMARASTGAVLVSFWQAPDGRGAGGTPSAWLRDLPGQLVEVYCACDADVAEERFRTRSRHTGHNDAARLSTLDSQFSELSGRYPLGIGRLIEVDTSLRPDIDAVVRAITGMATP